MSGKPNRKESYGFINLIAIVASFAVIVVILSVLLAKFVIDRSSELSSEEPSDVSDVSDDSGAEESTDESDLSDVSGYIEISGDYSQGTEDPYRIILLEAEDMHKGPLIIVNSAYRYDFDANPTAASVVNVYKSRTSKTFGVRDSDITIGRETMTHMQELLNALSAYTGSTALTVTTGFRSYDAQKKLYDEGKDVDGPGESDLNTGLSFKCTVYPSSAGKLGEGKFQWLDENCMFYGFVKRYPEGKKGLTGHDANNSLYRYVGVPHAYLIYVNNYCLEEYIDFCRRFSYESKYETTCDGIDYAIYYVPANPEGETQIKIPEGAEYEISGDNVAGFIVTLTLGAGEPIVE